MDISKSNLFLLVCLSSYIILVLIVNIIGIFWPAYIVLSTAAPSALITLFAGLFGTVIVDSLGGLMIIAFAESYFESLDCQEKNDCIKYMTGFTCVIVITNIISFLSIMGSFDTILLI